jgi:hypothetical protein
MATREQIEANRLNAKKSTGPRNTDRTRFNALTHGLRAETVVVPGEDVAAFEARRKAWFDDWNPRTHTRAVLVERAAVAHWRLDRAVRCEQARLHDIAADVVHEFDLSHRQLVDGGLDLLPRDPVEALARLRSHSAGLDRLIGFWDELALAVAEPAGWNSRADHHDRLLNLLGHRAGSEPQGLEVVGASLALLAGHDPQAAATVYATCVGRATELRRERSGYWDPEAYRRHLIDAAIAPTSKELQLMHRYEMAHEKSLRWALRELVALEKSGADLHEPPEAPVEAPAGTDCPEKTDASHATSETCDELASVGGAALAGDRRVPSSGSPGRSGGPDRPIGGDPGPEMAPERS